MWLEQSLHAEPAGAAPGCSPAASGPCSAVLEHRVGNSSRMGFDKAPQKTSRKNIEKTSLVPGDGTSCLSSRTSNLSKAKQDSPKPTKYYYFPISHHAWGKKFT